MPLVPLWGISFLRAEIRWDIKLILISEHLLVCVLRGHWLSFPQVTFLVWIHHTFLLRNTQLTGSVV